MARTVARLLSGSAFFRVELKTCAISSAVGRSPPATLASAKAVTVSKNEAENLSMSAALGVLGAPSLSVVVAAVPS